MRGEGVRKRVCTAFLRCFCCPAGHPLTFRRPTRIAALPIPRMGAPGSTFITPLGRRFAFEPCPKHSRGAIRAGARCHSVFCCPLILGFIFASLFWPPPYCCFSPKSCISSYPQLKSYIYLIRYPVTGRGRAKMAYTHPGVYEKTTAA